VQSRLQGAIHGQGMIFIFFAKRNLASRLPGPLVSDLNSQFTMPLNSKADGLLDRCDMATACDDES
jgi:hypothetical protein